MTLNERSTILLVVAAALRDERGRWLMQQRPEGKAHAELWEFPGGKLEPGESPEAALVRELAEELGIAVAAADLSPLGFATDAGVVMLLYRCTRWAGEARPLHAAALRWEVPAVLAELPMPPLDVPLIGLLV